MPQQGSGAAGGGAGGSSHRRVAQGGAVVTVSAGWERDVVRVAGPEAEVFLQGQLSQDVAAMGEGVSTWSFVLQPQGKVDVFLRITRVASDEFVLDTDAGWGERLMARLNRFKLRTKVDIEAMTASDPPSAAVALPDWPGFDDDSRTFEQRRIEAGFPKMGAEADESTIPAELGAHVIARSVSFTKGCYTGQELVARIDSRGGNVPRHLRVLKIDGDAPAGAALHLGDREVGRVTSVTPAGDEGAVVGLGFVARSVEVPAELGVRWDGGTAVARAAALPA
jgi:folate-binding protein YgfZ